MMQLIALCSGLVHRAVAALLGAAAALVIIACILSSVSFISGARADRPRETPA